MSRNLKIGIFITVAVVFTTFTFYFWQMAQTPNFQVSKDKDFALLIPTGATYQSVLDTLKKNEVVNDEISFRFMAKLLKLPERIKPGRYVLRRDMGNLEAIKKLRNGSQDAVRLTFNNIRLKEDLIQRVGSKFEFGPEALGKLLNDPAVCQKFGFDTTNVGSMFLPNTYEIFWTTPVDKFLGRMHDEYQKFWTPARLEKAKALGYTKAEVSVLASIVDAETNRNDEMPRIAGVYLNRIRQSMPLQADPTVIFAWRDFSIKRVTGRFSALNSPYNTYRVLGLPPGPINVPSTVAIDAVLNAEEHNYLYFCVKIDPEGKLLGYHDFAVTYDDHLLNARKYQDALNKMNIK
ncbi:endolytic transglycosylase MltG [Runella aurantiaca]|uniref:Endolytic murein transglycosylase n=1 Tax=Runella aurantiaca TaxID=2282308 RepID=A0A369ICU7_9BACT|nr:endolytic transglycosylase MltG [Runella aurantiaca]RDB04476.1 endolytic transglycosylase MltG [Runella aurantiaca]